MSVPGLCWSRVASRWVAGIRSLLGGGYPSRITDLNYDDYWRGYVHQVVDRFPISVRHLRRGETRLDIGCGKGTGVTYLVASTGVLGVGFDISPVAVETARSKGVDARVAAAVASGPALDYPFNTVLTEEVLEHVAELESVLGGIRDDVGKRLILAFPNIGYLPHRLRLLFGSFPVQWGWHPGEHSLLWCLSDFEWWLNQLGYRVGSVQASNGLRGLTRAWPSLFGDQLVLARPRR